MSEFHLFPRLPSELRQLIWAVCVANKLRIVDLNADFSDRHVKPGPNDYSIDKNNSFLLDPGEHGFKNFKATLIARDDPAHACREAYQTRQLLFHNISNVSNIGSWFPFSTGTLQCSASVLIWFSQKPWFAKIRHFVAEYSVDRSYNFRNYGLDYMRITTEELFTQLPNLETITFQMTFGLMYADIRRGSSHKHWLTLWFVMFEDWYNPPEGVAKATFRAEVKCVYHAPKEEWLTPENYTQVREAMQRQWEELSEADKEKHMEPKTTARS
ncbi:hypothetical protein VHEMI08091 [[Torrubiella] hemipterigena]|uniref:2EXR domain-containing protein n=1 Tax=[Torrubiella] hemipterigena TaxID=1531966 RepID=A0A0A1TMT7_9HYPO|nr:hypothetical protein VHEMI08091 [[Torrubiella] hemipterigena]